MDIAMEQGQNELMIGSDRLCIEDYLSRLPDLCLLEVLKHLPGSTIHSMLRVNKIMLPLYSWRDVKWEGGELSIFRTIRGYGFILRVRCKPVDGIVQPGFPQYPAYEYEVFKDVNGDYEEERNFTLTSKIRPNRQTGSDPIPEQFYTALSEILGEHQASMVYMDSIPLDSETVSKLKDALNGNIAESIHFQDMKFPTLTNEFRHVFAQLIKNVRNVDLKGLCDHSNIISEKFIRDIGESKIVGRVLRGREYHNGHFYPDESIVKYLIKFDLLIVDEMILNANWIPRLVMDYVQTRNKKSFKGGTWIFTVSHPITAETIARQLGTPVSEHLRSLHCQSQICDRKNNMSAILTSNANWSGAVQLTVNFFEN